MADIDIYVIDNSKFDLTMWLDSVLTFDDVGIKSVKDMVSKILKLCARGDRIAELRIVGHGNELGQYIGNDWISSGTLSKHKSDLRKLALFFGKYRHVIMGGCRQGRNAGLLLELSNIFNAPVTGFTAFQRPAVPGDEGGRTRCYITCTRTGKTLADKVDEYF